MSLGGRHLIVSVVGTRPEAIKIAPLALSAPSGPIEHLIVATGQHGALFDDALGAFGLASDLRLDPHMPGMNVAFAEGLERATRALAADLRPALILVQGDTNTAWAAARGAHAAGVPVGHVEAGLRSHDPLLPWPEERNRCAIDALSSLLFAPAETARANLAAEGIVAGVHVTGNTGIDGLLMIRDRIPVPHPDPGVSSILVTCHRRENFGAGIARIARALRRIARRPGVRLILPLHSNPAASDALVAALDGVDRVRLVPALGYPAMVAAMASSRLILSDSGGVQEDAPALGIPLLILRDNTERPDVLTGGGARLVGTDPDRIVAEVDRLLDDPAAHAAMAIPTYPYGRGDAARRIWAVVEEWLAAS